MQEEANQKTVGIVVEGGKFTGRMFLRACDKYTQHRRDKKHMRQKDPTKYKVNQPKQITVKQFMKEGEPVRKVELQTPEIKEFEKLARKNGLRFAVMKDKTSEKPQYMRVLKWMGKTILKGIIWLLQIPLTVVYFVFSFLGSLISGIGWLFGTAVFGITIVLWIFGQFDTWYQVATALAISAAIVWAPGFIVDFVGEGILFLKMALSELTI